MAIGSIKAFEFNVDGSKKGMNFLDAFYKWEADYFTEKFKLSTQIIERNTDFNFILFLLKGDLKDTHFETYFLFGEHNGSSYNLSIPIPSKWDSNTKMEFLKNSFASVKQKNQ